MGCYSYIMARGESYVQPETHGLAAADLVSGGRSWKFASGASG